MAFVVFTYGSHLPLLFIVAGLSFFVQYILDKILLTYWYELLPQQTDSLNFMFNKLLKYAPFSLLIVEIFSFGDRAISYRFDYFWVIVGFYCVFFILIALDLWIKFFEDPTQRFARVYGENKDFLSRLSTLERKRWIV